MKNEKSSISTNNFINLFSRYLTNTLDMFVEQDYSLVYFHYGLNSKNKPSLAWLWQAYRAFDRKYKKNLKALYLVHPTNFIRIIWNIFKAAIRYLFIYFFEFNFWEDNFDSSFAYY